MAEEEQMNETFAPDPHLNPLNAPPWSRPHGRKTRSGR